MTLNLTFEPFQEKHLPGALRMSADVGWPHRHEDWSFVANLSNGVIARQGDQVVATAMATPFGSVAMLNLIIVDAALRGRGLGREIMARAMQTASPAAWQLVATQEGLPLYEKMGFRTIGEIVQHQGHVELAEVLNSDEAQWATADDLIQIRQIDLEATGMDRQRLYHALERDARFAVLRKAGEIAGFAALRPFGRGEVAGPVVAKDTETAQNLLALILNARAGRFLRVDTGIETGLAPWLIKHGMAHVGGGLQMQKGDRPTMPTSGYSVFGLASQALG